MREVWVIGCYESPNHNYFPTHVSPVLIAATEVGYQRLVYKISRPYKIKPHALTGPVVFDPFGEYFPHPTYMLCKPKRCKLTDQFILLGPSDIYSSSSKVFVSMRVLIFAIVHIFHGNQVDWHRVLTVLIDAWVDREN